MRNMRPLTFLFHFIPHRIHAIYFTQSKKLRCKVYQLNRRKLCKTKKESISKLYWIAVSTLENYATTLFFILFCTSFLSYTLLLVVKCIRHVVYSLNIFAMVTVISVLEVFQYRPLVCLMVLVSSIFKNTGL